jgi:hypothetical protein
MFEFVAVFSCSLFTGASVYINLVEHPARMECGVEIATTEFAPKLSPSHYHAGEFGGFGTTILYRGMARPPDILVAGCWSPAGSVIPFTLFVILPTNKLLLSPK